MMSRLLVPLAVVCFAFQIRADDAKSTFESLYGARLKQVGGTNDKSDDLALARDILAAARSAPGDREFIVLMCEAVHDLSAKHVEGYSVAVDALTLLAESAPEKKAATREKQIDLLTKQSRIGKAEDRDAASEALIDLLRAAGDEKFEAKKWVDAAGEYRKALAAATPRKSPQIDEIKAKLDETGRRERADKQIASLHERLLKNANDSAVADELSRMFLLDLNDPAGALEFQTRTGDATLKEAVTLANRPAAELKTSDRIQLAQWYATAARSLRGVPQAGALTRAERLLVAALADTELHALPRTKAEVLLRDVRQTMPPAVVATVRPQPMQKFFSIFEKTDGMKVTNGVLEGVVGDIDHRNQSRLAKPVTGKTFRFSVRMKAPHYQCIWARVNGVEMIFSRGHWKNAATMAAVGGSEVRLNGTVAAADEWGLVEMEFAGGTVKFFHNGKLAHEMKVTNPREADSYEINVGFMSHETRVYVNEIVLTVDGKPQVLLKGK